jgi:hypothetical protein
MCTHVVRIGVFEVNSNGRKSIFLFTFEHSPSRRRPSGKQKRKVSPMQEPQTAFQTESRLDEPAIRRFRELCVRYSELGRKADTEILPYCEGSNRRFKVLPSAHQQGILASLESSIEICASAIENGVDLRGQNLSLVWWGLKKAKLRPLSDLFHRLDQTDLIEIYSLDDRQIFRSFNMFNCVSYSLEELFSYEWWELFRRDEAVTDSLQKVTQQFRAGHDKTIEVHGPLHAVDEVFSRRRRQARMRVRLFSPLFQANGRIGGYLVCSRVESVISLASGGQS